MNNIQKGDLVMIVKPTLCCGKAHDIGKIFVVSDVYSDPSASCTQCGTYSQTSLAWNEADRLGYDLPTLKKIEPLKESEGAATKKELPCTIK